MGKRKTDTPTELMLGMLINPPLADDSVGGSIGRYTLIISADRVNGAAIAVLVGHDHMGKLAATV